MNSLAATISTIVVSTAILLGLCSCGSEATTNVADNNAIQDAITSAASTTATSSCDMARSTAETAISSNYDNTITTEDCEIVIGAFEKTAEFWLEPLDGSMAMVGIPAVEGKTQLVSKCKITNLKKEKYYPSFAIDSVFRFDSGYEFEGDVETVNGDIDPLCSENAYIYASIPNELINNFQTCTVNISINKQTYDGGNSYVVGNELAEHTIEITNA